MPFDSLRTGPFLAEWYDLRDLGNAVGAFLDWIRDLGGPDWIPYVVSGLIGIVSILLWLLLSQLAFIWIERRVIGRMQARIGPNRVGPWGLLQPIADALKLLLKEAITNRYADRPLFWLGPVLIFIPALVVFAVIPFGEGMSLADLNVGVLFVIAITSINAIAIFISGWASNNKFALLGSMRAIAMLISYELVQAFALLGVVIFAGSMRLGDIVAWQSEFNTWMFLLQPLALVAFIIASAVEINRSPMDISEAESEIVAGYHTEYSGIKFGFFYAAEYFAAFAVSAVVVTLFLGGWTAWGLEEWVPGWLIFLSKLYLVFFLFIWTRGTLPRLRIDQLMAFSWKFLLELLFIHILVVGAQVLIWHEGDYPAEVVLPIFAVINWTLAVALIVGWATFMGHLSPQRRAKRAVLTQELGAIYYRPADGHGARPTRPLGDA
ncbi:MAG: NADH-quinone oxidoreductase subunit NuoH [Chloroflexi bacterium]|nr:NADH-quinone oxidoreductase subunit NuoH [Chloroflexota bacterium]